jgi:hypothetical protein
MTSLLSPFRRVPQNFSNPRATQRIPHTFTTFEIRTIPFALTPIAFLRLLLHTDQCGPICAHRSPPMPSTILPPRTAPHPTRPNPQHRSGGSFVARGSARAGTLTHGSKADAHLCRPSQRSRCWTAKLGAPTQGDMHSSALSLSRVSHNFEHQDRDQSHTLSTCNV